MKNDMTARRITALVRSAALCAVALGFGAMPVFAADLTFDKAGASMDGHPGLQIRELEGRYSVSPVGRSQNCKQRLILVNRQSLTIAKGPTLWGKVK